MKRACGASWFVRAVLLVALTTVPFGRASAAPTPEELDEELDELLEALESPDYQVRMLACREMALRAGAFLDADSGMAVAPGGGSTVSKLIKFFDAALTDGSQNVIREALRAATQTPLAAVWAHVKQVMHRERGADLSSVTRVIAVQAFTELTLLLDKVKAKDETEISSVTATSGVDQLAVVLTTDPAPSVRAASATGLATLDEENGIAVLEEALLTETNPLVVVKIDVALISLEGVFLLCPVSP